jgi:hypothetical protein
VNIISSSLHGGFSLHASAPTEPIGANLENGQDLHSWVYVSKYWFNPQGIHIVPFGAATPESQG